MSVGNEPLSLRAVGDINAGVGLGWRNSYLSEERTNAFNVRQGTNEILHKQVFEELKAGDIVFGNLEGPVSASYYDANEPPGWLMSPPELVELLDDCGFDVVNLANNHIRDYGDRYVEETIRRLEAAGIEYIGDPFADESPVTIREKGYDVTFVGYNLCDEGVRTDPEEVYEMAETIATRDGISVVSLHWGWGYEHTVAPSPAQIRMGRRLVEAGIDVILGHHTHTFQPVEAYENGVIAYCLGNFIFYQWLENNKQSGILDVTIAESDDGPRQYRLSPDVFTVENSGGSVYPKANDRIQESVPETLERIPSQEEYHRQATGRKKQYQRAVFLEYVRNIHRQPIRETLRRFRRWGSKYVSGV